jgi:CO/xanthine dehydrogenase FAD-binding subunit
MKPPAFQYERPSTLDEALRLLASHDGEAKLLAGGQSLVPMMNMRLAAPAVLIDINRLPELNGIRVEGDEIVIGALTRHREAETSALLLAEHPVLAEAARHISHVTIRNRGTIAGSLAHCDPAAEWPTVGLATQFSVVARKSTGERRIAIEDLLVGPFTTTLQDDEIITEVRAPRPPAGSGASFIEFSRVHGNFAMASVCAVVGVADGVITSARIALGGVASTAVLADDASASLIGERPTAEHLERAATIVRSSINPGTDVQATGEYRRQLAGTLVERALGQAIHRAQNPTEGSPK